MRLSGIDSNKLSDPARYFNDGFVLLEIKNSNRLVNLLNEFLTTSSLKENYFWETNLNSHHLRPDAFSYDESILDFIFDNEIQKKLEKHTCKRLTLTHIQIVKTSPGRSYQDWHRDSYQYGNDDWKGNVPPVHKIIFYPVYEKPEPRLKFIRSSNRCCLNNQSFDNNIISNFENEILYSDNNKVLMFDTSILHGVIPDVNPIGSIRIIYNFASEEQYLEKYESKDHHKRLHDLYEKKLKESL